MGTGSASLATTTQLGTNASYGRLGWKLGVKVFRTFSRTACLVLCNTLHLSCFEDAWTSDFSAAVPRRKIWCRKSVYHMAFKQLPPKKPGKLHSTTGIQDCYFTKCILSKDSPTVRRKLYCMGLSGHSEFCLLSSELIQSFIFRDNCLTRT